MRKIRISMLFLAPLIAESRGAMPSFGWMSSFRMDP